MTTQTVSNASAGGMDDQAPGNPDGHLEVSAHAGMVMLQWRQGCWRGRRMAASDKSEEQLTRASSTAGVDDVPRRRSGQQQASPKRLMGGEHGGRGRRVAGRRARPARATRGSQRLLERTAHEGGKDAGSGVEWQRRRARPARASGCSKRPAKVTSQRDSARHQRALNGSREQSATEKAARARHVHNESRDGACAGCSHAQWGLVRQDP